jgi:hypothetical protein
VIVILLKHANDPICRDIATTPWTLFELRTLLVWQRYPKFIHAVIMSIAQHLAHGAFN